MIPTINKILVQYHDTNVGTLQFDTAAKRCVFEYDKTWLSNGFSISPTELPLQDGLFFGDKEKFDGSFATFDDSLPDGYGLYLLEKMLRKQGTTLKELNPLQRLAIIGKNGMGALTYQPQLPGFNNHKEIRSEEILDDLQQQALNVLSEKNDGDTTLLYYNGANSGGARPKVAFASKNNKHWLIKFRHVYDPTDIGLNEAIYMNTAKKCGIQIPEIALVKGKYFAIQRFDYSPDGQRIHTLTAAALLKTDFRKQTADYTNLLALTGFITQDPIQVEEMYRRMIFNIVAINKDDHTKNFSFMHYDGKWTLAPAYDLTYSPQGSNEEHATSLYYDGNPGLDLAIKAGTQIRIPEERCLEIINKVEETCEECLPHIKKLTITNDKNKNIHP